LAVETLENKILVNFYFSLSLAIHGETKKRIHFTLLTFPSRAKENNLMFGERIPLHQTPPPPASSPVFGIQDGTHRDQNALSR